MSKRVRKPKSSSKESKILASRVLVESVPSSKSLSHREKRVAANLLAGATDGDDPVISRIEANETAQRPHVRDVLVEALARIGVGPEKIASVLAEGLDAERCMVTESGEVLRFKDHGIRHKFLETALQVVGAKQGREEVQQRPSNNVFVFRSFLGEKPVDVKIGAPTDAVVKRRMAAAKVNNRRGK